MTIGSIARCRKGLALARVAVQYPEEQEYQ